MSANGSARIGFWMAVALVMGNMIGSGIFLLPASLASYGGFGLIAWVVSAVGSLFLALVFARLARIHPASGGPYAFTRLGFGDLAGFLVAWGYWISVCCGNAAIALAFVGYLDPFFPTLVREPCQPPSWRRRRSGLTAVDVRGLREAGVVQVATTVLKILPRWCSSAPRHSCRSRPRRSRCPSSAREDGSKISMAAAMTFWAFGGLESATVPAGSVHDPQRTIARATIVGTTLTAIIYVVSTIGVMSVLPLDVLKTSTAPFADAAGVFVGPWAAAAVAGGAAIACFGALNGWILISGQVPMAIATDGLFPRIFGRVSGRDTPATALVISSVLTTR